MDWLTNILGLNENDLKSYQMVARAIIMFFSGLTLLRMSVIRMLGKQSAFDHLTVLVLGAIMGPWNSYKPISGRYTACSLNNNITSSLYCLDYIPE